MPDKHGDFSLSVHNLVRKPIWDKDNEDYALSFHRFLKTFCEQLSQAQKEIKDHLTDHALMGNSSDSIVSSVAHFIKNSTHRLMLHDELLANISKTLRNLDISGYREAKKKISQISAKINALSKDMALTQLDKQLALHHGNTLP